jgi:hypothetical protein
MTHLAIELHNGPKPCAVEFRPLPQTFVERAAAMREAFRSARAAMRLYPSMHHVQVATVK